MSIEKTIGEILSKATQQIVDVVTQSVRLEEQQRIAALLKGGAPTKPKKVKAESSSGRGVYKRPKTCKSKGCARKNKGPRFKFLCAEHHAESLLDPGQQEVSEDKPVTTVSTGAEAEASQDAPAASVPWTVPAQDEAEATQAE
jgi:hypothetical protein